MMPLSSRASPPPSLHPLSLHDALPISGDLPESGGRSSVSASLLGRRLKYAPCASLAPSIFICPSGSSASGRAGSDRKSTRLNSSHVEISYAVFCLKKKRQKGRHVLQPF